MASEPKMGTDGWIDLTVADAAEVRDFYSQVTGCHPATKAGGYLS